jgi:hypothetical protein
MPAPLLLLISGAPCTGKTSLGKRLSQDLYPLALQAPLFLVDTTDFSALDYPGLRAALEPFPKEAPS